MSREVIFSQIETVDHPISARRIGFDPANLPANSALLERLYPNWDRLVRDYPLPHVSIQDFAVSIPAGLQYDGASAITLPPRNSRASAVEIVKQPDIGSVGNQRLSVRYTIPPGGAIRFRVRAYGKPIPPLARGRGPQPEPEVEILHVTDMESVERLTSLMESKQHIAVLFEGDDATRLFGTGLFNAGEWTISRGPFGLPQIEINPTWGFVVMFGILAGALVSVVALLVLQRIVVLAITLGYRVEVREFNLTVLELGSTTLTLSFPTLALVLEPV